MVVPCKTIVQCDSPDIDTGKDTEHSIAIGCLVLPSGATPYPDSDRCLIQL